jgi:hypothetical protein
METIKISVLNTKLEDLGIEQDDEFVDFYFNKNSLLGYWIVQPEDPLEIMVYIGGHKFITPFEIETITKLNKMLNKNEK